MAYFGGGIFCSSSSVWGESHSLSHQNSNCAAWASLACLYSFRINKPQTNLASILNYWGMPTKECHWKQTEAHGTSWYKGPSVPSLLLLADKGFSLLGFLWVPKSRVKQLLIREVRGCRKGLPCSSNGKESACNARNQGSVPGSGISSGEGHGNPL